MLKDRDGVPFLMRCGLTRKQAREVISRPDESWELVLLTDEPGHPVALVLRGRNEDAGGYMTPGRAAKKETDNDADSRRAHEQQAAEISSHDPLYPCVSEEGHISADHPSFTPPPNPARQAAKVAVPASTPSKPREVEWDL
jgi:hypothetical protein